MTKSAAGGKRKRAAMDPLGIHASQLAKVMRIEKERNEAAARSIHLLDESEEDSGEDRNKEGDTAS